ncbi:MAG: cupin domain-containing protein [Betaproteobacteria bacterium]|nr:cupin domain-containing protein [Betaproteobacteria bacterium]
MPLPDSPEPHAAVVVPCTAFERTLAALTERLGFRVAAIYPADAPTTAEVKGYGLTLCLQAVAHLNLPVGTPVTLRIISDGAIPDINVPDLRIEWLPATPPLQVPEGRPERVFTPAGDDWGAGRAGMLYRDLLPGRYGGRFIASHIRIPAGGPVPDYVHFHKVRFQMIYCFRGWVRVVYEDQGEPFVLHAGDCVLQPPQIRHRVLEASPGLEVIEIGCPAVHETIADHDLALPNAHLQPSRTFDGQRFMRHVAADAAWETWTWQQRKLQGFEVRDTGIAAATASLAGVQVVRAAADAASGTMIAEGEFLFLVMLEGVVQLQAGTDLSLTLTAGASIALPEGETFSLRCETKAEFLVTMLPAP